MILWIGSWPSRKAGKATEVMIDFKDRGGMLMIRRQLAPTNAFELPPDRLQMPCRNEGLARSERRKRLLNEGVEVPAQEGPQDPGVRVHARCPHSLQS
jgi:hypothetical protein